MPSGCSDCGETPIAQAQACEPGEGGRLNRVLVVGGYGGFGARLCRRLGADGWQVIVAGRDRAKAVVLAATISGAEAVVADRNGDLAALLAVVRPAVLVDAAGPFQGSDYRVARACIAAGVHYLDLADARDFVCGIGAFDAEARAAGVAVIAGCSSVPALSGAAIAELARSMDVVDDVEIAISASNRATAGGSVAKAILSYAGQPIGLWRGRRWDHGTGLQHLVRERFAVADAPPLRRLVALAEVPDLTIVPDRLAGRPATIFRAGPEFGFQLLALWLLSWPVRWGWLRSLSALAPVLLPLQRLTSGRGGERSAMTVQLKGRRYGRGGIARWTLIAEKGCGPEIPILAAQLFARHLHDTTLAPGARPAAGLLDLDAFRTLLAEMPVVEDVVVEPYVPLYARVMADRFDALPEPVRAMHAIVGDGGAVGKAAVERGTSVIARLIARIMRFPPMGEHVLHVAFAERDGVERWTRDFGGHRFVSELNQSGNWLVERFGPLRFRFALPSDAEGLTMVMQGWSAFGIPLPMVLAPRSRAREWADGDRFRFDVPITLPLVGRVVHYRGWLTRV